MSVQLNKFGEVADFTYPVNQFFDGTTSEDACGPYSTGYIKYMGAPGTGTKGITKDIDAWAFAMYTKYIGPDIKSNHNGTDVPQLYAMLKDAAITTRLEFNPLALTVDAIKQSIAIGRPVIVAAAETGMHDVDNGNKVDYSWTPSGNHIIVVSGVRADGALLVRDPANIGATGQRGSGDAATHSGPVAYSPTMFGPIVSVTAITPYWQLTPAPTPTPVSLPLPLPPVQTNQALRAALAPLVPIAQAILDAYKASA